MKNILLLTDFSINAQNAINYAMEFFKGSSTNFHLLHIQKSSGSALGDLMSSSSKATVYESMINEPKSALKKIAKKLMELYSSESYSFEVTCDYDDFISAINQTIRLKKIDLIVMGTNGATGASEVVFGSNTMKVIRSVDCPLLAIPEKYNFVAPRTVLFATAVDEKFTETPLKPLIYAVAKFNSNVQILTLEKDTHIDILNAKKNKMSRFFKGHNHNFYSIENVPVDIAIDSFVQIKQVDLTAKIINKESFLKRLISGSSTDEITYKTRVPLLIMHP